ncbi:hypothetical protein PC129_g14814 [Phytophthora cactorum]|uniref:Uncharacterized protein n=1 Tax=Phytophthora cactorum TaxID=29920 RepID=A0A8T1HQY5_9STRA|nr:hypothetical protein PC129_g14814 [Phytophthora cactorum]
MVQKMCFETRNTSGHEAEELMEEKESPSEAMYVTAVLCAESFLHLDNNRGTRVVFVDGFMKSHFKGIALLGGLVSIWARCTS